MNDTNDTLESKLRHKLEAGEIDQQEYEELYQKFQSLGILKSRSAQTTSHRKYPQSGSKVLEGGKIDGPVSISGRALIDSSVECTRLNISGSAIIDGDLTVLGKSLISGSMEVEGTTRFGDSIVSSGEMKIEQSLFAMAKCSIAGRAKIEEQLISDGQVILTGELHCRQLRSTSSVKVNGKLDIGSSLICKDFECLNGKGVIGQDLKAEMIRIFTNFREISTEIPEIEDNVESADITQLVSNVVNVFFPNLVKTFTSSFTDPKPSAFEVGGNLEGKVIDISHTHVKGDVTGERISIGPEVTIEGTIYYSQFIEVPEGSTYRIKKLEQE